MTTKKNSLVLASQTRTKLVPPDGGWGWMVVFGAALTNIFNQSMLSLFGLLYGDILESMGHRTQGAAIVLSTMLFVSNFSGPVAGVLLKLTSPRFTAVTGSCFCTAGIFLSGFTSSIGHLIFSYGVLLGIGLGFIQNSTFVAINSYFVSRKSRAVGLANVGTGIGQTLMPHFVRYLLEHYGFRGACFILTGTSLHGIAGTLLIHPVQRHMKEIEEEISVDEKIELLEEKHKNIVIRDGAGPNDRRATEPNILINGQERNGISQKSNSELHVAKAAKSQENGLNGINNNNVGPVPKKTFLKKMYDLFDISLLSSPRFLNIIIGTALSVTSIQNFSMIFPFFLQKVASMDKQQTAMCMSAVAMADISGRLILPTFQDKYRIKARWMLIMTCVWLIISRQILANQTGLNTLLVMSAIYGFGRSMVIVARNIAISEHCRPDQVPAAVGLGMMTMGIIVPPTGYFLGWIRDYTGSYVVCITAQNLLLIIVLVTWLPDMFLLHMAEKRRRQKSIEENL